MNSNFLFFAAFVASLIIFFVARRIFEEKFRIGPPSLLAAAVAGLALLGLLSYGPMVVALAWAVIKWTVKALLLLLLICVLILMFIIMVFTAAAGADERSRSEQFTPHPPWPPPSSDLLRYPEVPRRPRRPRSFTGGKPAGLSQTATRPTGLRGPL